jgi:hypothetical protein
MIKSTLSNKKNAEEIMGSIAEEWLTSSSVFMPERMSMI